MLNRRAHANLDTLRYGEGKMASEQTPASLWLYAAGLCVTLAGLYAVNFSVDDPVFAQSTFGAAIAGYIFSYIVRLRQISFKSIQFPLLVSASLLALAYVSGSGAGWLIPAGLAENTPQQLQVLFAWVAIIHSFMLLNDASVLFVCVPAMTMLALVSTVSPNGEMQNPFMVFIGAATFLMVHENYLRTRNVTRTGDATGRGRKLFQGQLLLTGACLAGAFLLANLVALPIQSVGQSLFGAGINPLASSASQRKQGSSYAVRVNEMNSYDLATGPTAENDIPLLRITAARGLYWRGTTYSNYTGNRFESPFVIGERQTLAGEQRGESQVTQLRQFANPDNAGAFANRLHYRIPPSRFEPAAEDMKGSHRETQHVQVIGGMFSALYGASVVRDVTTALTSLNLSAAGTLEGDVSQAPYYDVESQVVTSDERLLRAASTSLEDVPASIRNTYLQIPDTNPIDVDRMKKLALELTRDKTNNLDKAEAIRQYIARECKYNLQARPAPRDKDVVAWFLFDEKEGYCDCFGAAMTMLCRYAGIPARLVSGFLPGELEPSGSYLVKEKHKHLWTEVFFPHVGWVTFDATDGSQDISNHSNEVKSKPVSFAAWLKSHGSVVATAGLILTLLLSYVIKTEVVDRLRTDRSGGAAIDGRAASNRMVIDAYLMATALLGRWGLPRASHQTPEEYLAALSRQVETHLPGLLEPMAQLTRLHTRFCYGRETATTDEVGQARQSAASIRATLQAIKPRDLNKLLSTSVPPVK